MAGEDKVCRSRQKGEGLRPTKGKTAAGKITGQQEKARKEKRKEKRKRTLSTVSKNTVRKGAEMSKRRSENERKIGGTGDRQEKRRVL